jgi:DNA-directed RNA polymerase specialized sigma24 family protein
MALQMSGRALPPASKSEGAGLQDGNRSLSDEPEMVATEHQVRAALEALSVTDRLRLANFAKLRVRALGAKAAGDHEELLHEAFVAVLEGRRKWKPGLVSMADLLAGIIRSISSHWAEAFDPETARLESDLSGDSKHPSPLATAPSGRPDQERELAAKQELEELQRHFKDDDTVVLIIEGFRDGMTGPEIREALGISPQDYDAARKRMIRYRGKSEAEGRQGNA